MNDKWDIEYGETVEKYVSNVAKYKVGDIVHTWQDGKCITGVVINSFLSIYDNDAIIYDIVVGNIVLLDIKEYLLTKVGHIHKDTDFFAPIEF